MLTPAHGAESPKSLPGSGKTVLITGASGFIGRHCVDAALDAGFDVHAITPRGRLGNAQSRARWHEANLLDPAATRKMLESVRPSHLLHLAWIAKPGVYWTSSANFDWLSASIVLFRVFFEHGGERALGVGTCAEYAWTMEDLSEDLTPLKPETTYGRCKLAASLELEAAAASSGSSAAWARLFFPYGPGEPADRLIPWVIQGLLKGERVECTEGRQIRDFVFVKDVADALLAILSSGATGAFNIGSGNGLALREVVAIICSRLGGADLIEFGARAVPPGDPARVVADMTRLRHELGWKPKYSIEAGIDHTIAALRETVTAGNT
jgi:nucleoside-diphosphate-sugar epimerase